MWYRIIPKTEQSLDVAEKRLNSHGYFVNREFIERVQMRNDDPDCERGTACIFMEDFLGCQDTWLELLLGDICTISTVRTLKGTKNIQDAISTFIGEYPTPKGSQ